MHLSEPDDVPRDEAPGPIERYRRDRAERLEWIAGLVDDLADATRAELPSDPHVGEVFMVATTLCVEHPQDRPARGGTPSQEAMLSLWRSLGVWAREVGEPIDPWAVEWILAHARRRADAFPPARPSK